MSIQFFLAPISAELLVSAIVASQDPRLTGCALVILRTFERQVLNNSLQKYEIKRRFSSAI